MDRLTPEERAASLRLGKRTTADAVKQIRAAVAARDAEWREAILAMSEDCSMDCLSAAEGNDCEDAAPLRKLMEEK